MNISIIKKHGYYIIHLNNISYKQYIASMKFFHSFCLWSS